MITEKIVAASKLSGRRLAGRDTPFILNCWYVAGFVEDFKRSLTRRIILGRPLVLYLTEAGEPAALDDRCPHRSFPLSRGQLVGDNIVCGYHGMTYDRAGNCILIPGQAETRQGIGVRSYPLRVQGPLVWIWMGEPGRLPELPFDAPVEDEKWPHSRGYFHLQASYIALHENLLDLSHLTYIHASSFGTPDYALAPYSVDCDHEAGRFSVKRSVIPTILPPVWARYTGLEGKPSARITNSAFVAPSTHHIKVNFYDCNLSENERGDMAIFTGHLLTPETATSTHYFILNGRNFAVGNDAATQFIHDQLWIAFNEDVEGLEALEHNVAETPEADLYEISIAADRAGVEMRRWLLKAALAEA